MARSGREYRESQSERTPSRDGYRDTYGTRDAEARAEIRRFFKTGDRTAVDATELS